MPITHGNAEGQKPTTGSLPFGLYIKNNIHDSNSLQPMINNHKNKQTAAPIITLKKEKDAASSLVFKIS